MKKIETVHGIYDIVCKGVVKEDELRSEYKQAFNLYRKQRRKTDFGAVKLYSWQEDLLQNIDEPSNREVIWVRGAVGNEGKTWFQNYVQSQYDYDRVVRLDLKAREKDIFHILTKRTLFNTDIFLFNDARSGDESLYGYSALEAIKDGFAMSIKYNSTPIEFHTPNIVIVFSNTYPNVRKLSLDRWVVYDIKNNTLYDVNINDLAASKLAIDEDKDR